MTEPNTNNTKEWEKFDEVSLKNVTIVDEQHESEQKESNNQKPEDSHHPLEDTENTSGEETTEKPPSPPPKSLPNKPKTYVPPERRIPKIPAAPHSVPPKTPTLLDVVKLEDRTPRPSKPSVISDPTAVNSKVLATVYPDNVICDWVTPPHYDAFSMPSILAIDVPTLPAEDYIACIECIIKDTRFKMFSTIYSRFIAVWMTLWILLLTVYLLLQTKGGWPVMIMCLIWAVLLFVGIYACAMIRKRIRIGLNHVVKKANKIIVDRHFLAGVEDRGQLSCHKVVIHFIRFNVGECTADVIKQLKIKNSGGCVFGGSQPGEANDESIEREAASLILEYSQEYVKSVVKKRLIFPNKPIHGVSSYAPKHCKTQMCLCQFIDKKKFDAKPKKWYEKYI